jgi:hypothetical protein
MHGKTKTTSGDLGRLGKVVLAVILVVSAFAPAVAGVASASTSASSAPDADTYPDAGGWQSSVGTGVVAAQNESNESDGDGWTWPWDDVKNGSNETGPTGPPETEFNATLLRQNGEQVSDRPSVRKFGPGTVWLRHVPTGPLAVDDPANHSQYVSRYSIVTRDHVWIGGFLGWDAPSIDATVHVVSWTPERTTYTVEEGNRTVTKTKTVPANVTHNRMDRTIPGGDFFRIRVSLPAEYGETRMTAIWLESPQIDESRWKTQWAFRKKVNPATQTVPQQSLAARIQWAALVFGGSTALTALAVLWLGKKLLDKIGAVIIHPAELFFAVFAPTVPIVLLFYNSIISAFAQRPQLIGIGLGTVVGLVGVWIIREKPQEWLFLQVTPETDMDETGRGKWYWANRAHHVIERGDGRLAVPRPGWIPALARAWPFYDATPLLEFDAHSIEDYKVDSVDEIPDDVDVPDDASILDKLKTRFVGDGETDEYDEIVLVHPGADDVMDHSNETLTVGFPTLWEWPDDGEGVRIGPVPLPSVRFGLIAFGLAFVFASSAFVTWLTTSILLGLITACLAVVALAVHPTEDTKAHVDLAPAAFDAVISNVIATFEGLNDHADRNYWKDRALEAEADRRLDAADERERTEMTKLRRLGQRMAPERDADADPRRQGARERYGVGDAENPSEAKGDKNE